MQLRKTYTDGSKAHLVTELQDAYGRSAVFVHGGAQKLFTYAYLTGTHLLQTLTKPNNMSLTLSYEAQRDLLTGMVYRRGNTTVATRSYAYDTLGRPSTRSTAKDGITHSDVFHYTKRSELVNANLNGVQHGYDYDNIGNRRQAIEGSNYSQYTANNLNQYTDIYGSVNGQEFDFTPTFDDAGNQTLVKTSTGIWSVVYDAENRPISFTNAESATVVECTYDYMGRRATKKVTVSGSVTLHHPPPQTLSAMARRACLPSQSGNTAEESDRLRDLMGIAMGLRAFYFERWKKNINSYKKDCQYVIK